MFYRLDLDDDWAGLSAERFFTLAERTVAYRGVMRAIVEAEAAEQDEDGPGRGVVSEADLSMEFG